MRIITCISQFDLHLGEPSHRVGAPLCRAVSNRSTMGQPWAGGSYWTSPWVPEVRCEWTLQAWKQLISADTKREGEQQPRWRVGVAGLESTLANGLPAGQRWLGLKQCFQLPQTTPSPGPLLPLGGAQHASISFFSPSATASPSEP